MLARVECRAAPRRFATWLPWLAVVTFWSAGASGGSPQADVPVTLSVQEALARAETRAPEVSFARHAVKDAEARRVGAAILFPQNPRLSVDVRPPLRGGAPSDVGYGATADAFHVTAPHEHGAGGAAAMKMALFSARATVGDLGYINAHGTGTPLNDQSETRAI